MTEINKQWPWATNVGVLGTYAEEVKALQRNVEKNPDASPMPQIAPTKLLTPNLSSDNLRMGENYVPPEISESTAIPLTHVVFRRLLMKSRRKGVIKFDEAVEAESLDDLPSTRRDQMRSMLARESSMLEILERYNSLAEAVYMRLLSESKG